MRIITATDINRLFDGVVYEPLITFFLVRYLDKEAGVMVGKFFKLNDKEDSEMTQAKEGEQQLSSDKACLDDESIIYFLGRKIIQV